MDKTHDTKADSLQAVKDLKELATGNLNFEDALTALIHYTILRKGVEAMRSKWDDEQQRHLADLQIARYQALGDIGICRFRPHVFWEAKAHAAMVGQVGNLSMPEDAADYIKSVCGPGKDRLMRLYGGEEPIQIG